MTRTCLALSVGSRAARAMTRMRGSAVLTRCETRCFGVHPGAIPRLFGNRKTPTAAYNGDTPVLHFDEKLRQWVGGLFFDGRATGEGLNPVLGDPDPLAEQALSPFVSLVEQNNPTEGSVVRKVALSEYANLFKQVWGPDSLDPSVPDELMLAYERIARSIAAYERSAEVNPFTSKFDYFLAGKVELTAQEALGWELFNDDAQCNLCHLSDEREGGLPPLFTNFSYNNLGVPKNPDNPFYLMPKSINPDGADFIDLGLGGFLRDRGEPQSVFETELGKHRVPTLRNIDRRPSPGFVKAFMHNGVFKTLEEVVHFYNTRDVEVWPAAELPLNVSVFEMGNLGLSSEEEAAVVSFMKTLTDGFVP